MLCTYNGLQQRIVTLSRDTNLIQYMSFQFVVVVSLSLTSSIHVSDYVDKTSVIIAAVSLYNPCPSHLTITRSLGGVLTYIHWNTRDPLDPLHRNPRPQHACCMDTESHLLPCRLFLYWLSFPRSDLWHMEDIFFDLIHCPGTECLLTHQSVNPDIRLQTH